MDVQSWLAVCVLVTISLCFMVLSPILLAFRESRRKLELDHAARMKSIELGRPLPREDKREEEPWKVAARLAWAIGVVVPLGSLGCAFLASLVVGFHQDIWMAGMTVGLAGVICGGLLAGRTFGATKHLVDHADLKPYVEEDAYDVVGVRG